MFGLDRDAAQLAGLISSEEEYSSGPFGVPFEHPAYLRESRWCGGHEKRDHIIRHSSRKSRAICELVTATRGLYTPTLVDALPLPIVASAADTRPIVLSC